MRTHQRMFVGIVTLCLTMGLIRPQAAFSQDAQKELRDWLSGRLGSEAAADAFLKRSDEFIKLKLDKEKMSLTLGSALASDIVDDKLERTLVNVEAKASRGIYPDQLDFRFSSLMEVKEGALNEYVSAMQMSYERYLLPAVELFGFFERFSDSYLHLQQRYEIGLGVKLEGNLFDRSQDVFVAMGNHRAALGELHGALLAEYATALGLAGIYAGRTAERTYGAAASEAAAIFRRLAPAGMGPAPSEAEFLRLCAETAVRLEKQTGENARETTRPTREALPAATPDLMERLNSETSLLRKAWLRLKDVILSVNESRQALEKDSARVSLGLTAAIFYEADRAQAAWASEEGFFAGLDPVTLPSEQRFRLSVRPSIKWRPLPGLSLDVRYYFKLPVGENLRKVSLLDGKSRLDVRHDASFALSYMHPKPLWATRVGLALEYTYTFDNVPSYLDENVVRTSILGAESFAGFTLQDIVPVLQKARKHGQAKLSLIVAF